MTTVEDCLVVPTEGARPSSAPIGPWAVLAAMGVALAVVGVLEVSRIEGAGSAGLVLAPIMVGAWLCGGLALLRRSCLLGRPALLGAAAGATAYLGVAIRLTTPDGLVGRPLLVAGGLAIPAIALHFLVAMPDGSVAGAGRRTLVVTGYAAAAACIGIWLAQGRSTITGPVIVLGLSTAVGGAIPATRRWVATVGLARQRLQWIGCAVIVTVVIGVAAAALRLLTGWPQHTGLVVAVGSLAVPLALVASSTALVHRADRLLVATVSITGLISVVLGVYVIVVVGLGRSPTSDERQIVVLSMAAAGVSALLYLPARTRLGEVANRIVYGERHAPDEAIKTFGSRLSRAIPMDELLLQLVESLKKTLTLRSAEIWTGGDGRYDRVASVPDRPAVALHIDDDALPVVTRAGPSGTTWVSMWLPQLLVDRPNLQVRLVPISHSGDLLGLMVLDRTGVADPFGEEDDLVLTELARQVGLALHNVQLDSALQASLDEVRRYAGELQASRARIVATADAERRKIERNLHDGAQQHLVALAVNLKLAGDMVGDDAEMASSMLAMLGDTVKDTIQELRDLAHGIYPPLLMDSGLPEALPAAAGRSPLDVTVDASVGRYPTEVEAAVYFCCTEALQNAGKHAPEASVSVRVWEEPVGEQLRFTVSDDGPGYDTTVATSGHGYVNMSDRLGAIGGCVAWRSVSGAGAEVEGSVPLDG